MTHHDALAYLVPVTRAHIDPPWKMRLGASGSTKDGRNLKKTLGRI